MIKKAVVLEHASSSGEYMERMDDFFTERVEGYDEHMHQCGRV